MPTRPLTATWNPSRKLGTLRQDPRTEAKTVLAYKKKKRSIAISRKRHTSRCDYMLRLLASMIGCIVDHGCIRCRISSTCTTSCESEKRRRLKHRSNPRNALSSTHITPCRLCTSKKWGRGRFRASLAHNANNTMKTMGKAMLYGIWPFSD